MPDRDLASAQRRGAHDVCPQRAAAHARPCVVPWEHVCDVIRVIHAMVMCRLALRSAECVLTRDLSYGRYHNLLHMPAPRAALPRCAGRSPGPRAAASHRKKITAHQSTRSTRRRALPVGYRAPMHGGKPPASRSVVMAGRRTDVAVRRLQRHRYRPGPRPRKSPHP